MTAPTDLVGANRRWNRGSWAAAVFALFIAAYTSLQFISILGVPTDGWIADIDQRPAVPRVALSVQIHDPAPGARPFLQAGDVVVAVNGEPVRAIFDRGHPQQYIQPNPPDWQPGTQLVYRVERQSPTRGVTLTLDVPVTLTAVDFGEVMAGTVRRAPVTGVLQLFASPFFFIVSAIVFLLRPRQPAAHALLHIGTGFLFQATPNVSSVPLLFYGGVPRSTAVPWDYWTGAILPGLLYLVLAFPTPKWPLRVWPRLTVAAIYVGPMLAINLAYLANLHDRLAFGQVSLLIYASAGSTVLIATLLSLTHSARRLRDPVARSQLKWMTIGLLSFVVLGIGGWFAGVMGVWAELAQSLATFGWFVFPVTLAIAITRYRLFDIDLIIRRTLIYSALTAVLALAYLGSVLLLQSIFQALTGRAQDQLVAVVSTLVIAALFGPLRWRVQNVIDRRFYRRKYDAAKIVTAFGSALRDDVELNRLAAHLVETVEAAMEPAHTTLLLKAQPIGPYQPLTP